MKLFNLAVGLGFGVLVLQALTPRRKRKRKLSRDDCQDYSVSIKEVRIDDRDKSAMDMLFAHWEKLRVRAEPTAMWPFIVKSQPLLEISLVGAADAMSADEVRPYTMEFQPIPRVLPPMEDA